MADKNIYTVVVADDEGELREAVLHHGRPGRPWGSTWWAVPATAWMRWNWWSGWNPDLLLTDIRMPFISGIELARQVREIRPAMHIAFLSGYDDFEYAKQAIQYNIISYMLKPLTMDGLAAELKAIHEKIDQRYASLRRSDDKQADQAAFLIPLVLEHYDGAPEGLENSLRENAAACGLLRGVDDRGLLVVLTAVMADGTPCKPGVVRLVEQLANKYLRHFVFLSSGRVVAVLIGNPSDFDEYLHIWRMRSASSPSVRWMSGCLWGWDGLYPGFLQLNVAYRQALAALHAAEESEGRRQLYGGQPQGGRSVRARPGDHRTALYGRGPFAGFLSAMLDVSPNHLSACIKKTAGETFINILVRRRMEAAQKLLLTTDLQVQEIARRCGYSDQHYFSYCFKKYSGTSPGALRRQRAPRRPGKGCLMKRPCRPPRTAPLIVILITAVAAVTLLLCAGTFLQSYRASVVLSARTSSAQAVSQVVGTVSNYVDNLEETVSDVMEAMNTPADTRDAYLNAWLNARSEVVAVTTYAADGTMQDCWALEHSPRAVIFRNLSFDLSMAQWYDEGYISSPHVESIFEGYYPWVVTVVRPCRRQQCQLGGGGRAFFRAGCQHQRCGHRATRLLLPDG